jgi:hypothetical protein
LEKISNNDPNGGYKAIGVNVEREYIFEGWIYRPIGYPGGDQDRLSISNVTDNMKSDGYGFGITGSKIYIEKRDGNSDRKISQNVNFNRVNDEWYKFIFKGNSDNSFDLYIFDQIEDFQAKVTTDEYDDEFTSFDSIVIHGGFNYFVDDLKLFAY